MEEKEFNWLKFLQPYDLAVSGFVLKLESIRKQYILAGKKNPIESVRGRVKTPKSIMEKLKRMNVDFSDVRTLSDIGGIRIICKYEQEVYEIFELLKARKDIEIFLIKDYIKNPKPSGYRSLHVIAKYNAETIDGQMPINIEFQIRTLAMHLWASIEHSLKYKYYRNIPENIQQRLVAASKITENLDNEMSKIKDAIEKIEITTREDKEMLYTVWGADPTDSDYE